MKRRRVIKDYNDVTMGDIQLVCEIVKALMEGITNAPNDADKRACKVGLNFILAEVNSSEV